MTRFRKDGATLCISLLLLCFLTCTNTSENRGKTMTPFSFVEDEVVNLDSVFAAAEAKMDADAARFDSNVRIIKKARRVPQRLPMRVPELRPAKDTTEFIETHQSPHGRWFEQIE